MDGAAPRVLRRLPRLQSEHYRGRAIVHWSMTIERRSHGWLDALHHARLRELLCHALGRHGVVCAAYCLMPDHGHFLLCGVTGSSDQRLAVHLFRKTWNALLAPSFRLQAQAHDHVLRDAERANEAFKAIAWYIRENPVRATLADRWQHWPCSGCLVPGYPDLDPRQDGYWELIWRIWNRLSETTA
ncbi:MAG TPA: hypothetical protein PK322_13005 [Opitutaceae bacterium]|nr:hypothetical protein [Opitutaceae bacterium]